MVLPTSVSIPSLPSMANIAAQKGNTWIFRQSIGLLRRQLCRLEPMDTQQPINPNVSLGVLLHTSYCSRALAPQITVTIAVARTKHPTFPCIQ